MGLDTKFHMNVIHRRKLYKVLNKKQHLDWMIQDINKENFVIIWNIKKKVVDRFESKCAAEEDKAQ